MFKKEIKVDKAKKLLEVLADNGFSYSLANKLLRNKDVRLNGKICKDNAKLQVGDLVTVFFKEEVKKFQVEFESENVLIICKQASISSEEVEKETEAYLVHRLDRNTEGLMVLAKNLEAKTKLEKAFKNHKVEKLYLCEVGGFFQTNKLYTAYLVKDAEKSFVKIYDKNVIGAQKIQTRVETLKVGKESSLLKVEIISGKTHQIRAHLAHLGHAIIGDGKYARREDFQRFKEKHQKLFAYSLAFKDVGIEEIDNKTFQKYPKWMENVKL